MNAKQRGFSSSPKQRLMLAVVDHSLRHKPVRDWLLRRTFEKLRRFFADQNPHHNPALVQERGYVAIRNLLAAYSRALADGRISSRVRQAFVRNFLGQVVMGERKRMQPFRQKYGYDPPVFITISPTQVCNLACKGCYAASHKGALTTMPFRILQRVLAEKREAWGSHFTVLSGGEPMLYRRAGPMATSTSIGTARSHRACFSPMR